LPPGVAHLALRPRRARLIESLFLAALYWFKHSPFGQQKNDLKNFAVIGVNVYQIGKAAKIGRILS